MLIMFRGLRPMGKAYRKGQKRPLSTPSLKSLLSLPLLRSASTMATHLTANGVCCLGNYDHSYGKYFQILSKKNSFDHSLVSWSLNLFQAPMPLRCNMSGHLIIHPV